MILKKAFLIIAAINLTNNDISAVLVCRIMNFSPLKIFTSFNAQSFPCTALDYKRKLKLTSWWSDASLGQSVWRQMF